MVLTERFTYRVGGLAVHAGGIWEKEGDYPVAKITLRCGPAGDRLNANPTNALTPELLDELRAHKKEIVQILREDEEMRRTGIIQAERQVFDFVRQYFGEQDEAGVA